MDLSQRSDLTQSVHRSSGSYELVVGATLFALMGLLVDRIVGTTPWFTVAFACIGFMGACLSVYYRYQVSMSHEAAQRDAARAPATASVSSAAVIPVGDIA